MRLVPLAVTASFALAFGLGATPSQSNPPPQELRERLAGARPAQLDAESWEELKSAYAERGDALLWSGGPQADQRLGALNRAMCGAVADLGLPADRFKAPVRLPTESAAAFDVRASMALVRLGRALGEGWLDPRQFRWGTTPTPVDARALMQSAAGDPSLQVLDALASRHGPYVQLQQALADLRRVAARGGWPEVSPGGTINVGMADSRVREVRAYLVATGDLEKGQSRDSDEFDAELATAVMEFQRRHELTPNGVVGRYTLAAMRVPVEQRIAQLELNLERWRWMPANLGERALIVNVPGFELWAFQRGERVRAMKVVVGDREWHTPLFTSTITGVVLNPTWIPTRGIVRRELLPKAQKDPGFLGRVGLKVVDRNGHEVDPHRVNWGAYNGNTLPYRLMQDPGEDNPLGQYKFVVAGTRAIYLHDTPAVIAFTKSDRAFSHGCIRLEDAPWLFEFVLAGSPEADPASVAAALSEPGSTPIEAPKSVPVYFAYFTAFVDDRGRLHFTDDVYGRDAQMMRSLTAAQRGAQVAAECGS